MKKILIAFLCIGSFQLGLAQSSSVSSSEKASAKGAPFPTGRAIESGSSSVAVTNIPESAPSRGAGQFKDVENSVDESVRPALLQIPKEGSVERAVPYSRENVEPVSAIPEEKYVRDQHPLPPPVRIEAYKRK